MPKNFSFVSEIGGKFVLWGTKWNRALAVKKRLQKILCKTGGRADQGLAKVRVE